MDRSQIPDIVIGRLPLYLRALRHLEQAGFQITSSQDLGERLGISPAQIRKDLSLFGEFGKQGTGYTVSNLIAELKHILNVESDWPVALIGVGDLGRAIANYGGFTHRGFSIEYLFDNDPEKIGTEIKGVPIKAIEEITETIKEAKVKIAMIATPAEAAQAVADMLVEAGITAILNYAPISISVPGHVQVQYTDPIVHLQQMAYYLW